MKISESFSIDNKVLIRGRTNFKEDESPKIIAEEIVCLDSKTISANNTKQNTVLLISVTREQLSKLDELENFIRDNLGNTPVGLYIKDENKVLLQKRSKYQIQLFSSFIKINEFSSFIIYNDIVN